MKITHLALAAFFAGSLHLAQAQSADPLIDKLVQKGVLSDQEAEDLRADLIKDFNQTPAGKLNISDSIKELKFYGDIRYRYQNDDQQKQVADTAHTTQRSRSRFRLRLYTDLKLAGDYFAGFGLETANAADSGNQTVDPGFADSNIYISRWFLGRNFSDFATVILGKQKNPFYSNELYWDADINPVGITENVAFHKLLGFGENSPSSRGFQWGSFELSFVAGQFIYNTDNDESKADGDAANDVYLFEQQLIGSYRFENKVSVTLAPALIFYNAGDMAPAVKDNSLNGQPFAEGDVSGESRDLFILNVPGEIKFPLGNLNSRFYGELAWNFSGEDRFTDILGLNPATYDNRQSTAWLLGLEVGQGKGQGAWTVFANYRRVGIASIDPNLNDSDFAASRLNIKGWRVGATYGITDFLSVTLSAQIADNLDDTIRGGQATGGANLADLNSVNIYQVDVNVKF